MKEEEEKKIMQPRQAGSALLLVRVCTGRFCVYQSCLRIEDLPRTTPPCALTPSFQVSQRIICQNEKNLSGTGGLC